MAEQAVADAEAEAPPVRKKKISGKKLVLFIILPLILFGGGGAAAWFLLFQGQEPVEGEHADAEAEAEHPPVYYDLDEMTVNLSNQSKRNSYLKLRLSLELGAPEDSETLPNVLPRVVDQFPISSIGRRS